MTGVSLCPEEATLIPTSQKKINEAMGSEIVPWCLVQFVFHLKKLECSCTHLSYMRHPRVKIQCHLISRHFPPWTSDITQEMTDVDSADRLRKKG